MTTEQLFDKQTRMNVALVTSGAAKLDDVQSLLLSPGPRRLLRAQLRALLSAGANLGPRHLRHVRYRPGRRLMAYYDVQVQTKAMEGYLTRPVAVTWGSRDANQCHETVDPATIQAEAVSRGLAAPFRQLMANLPDLGMNVWVWPLDERFVQLVRLSDPVYVRRILADAFASPNTVSDKSRLSEYSVTSMRYRPGKRHVLRYQAQDSRGATVFAKLYCGEDGAHVFRTTTYAADWLAEHRAGVSCPRPLAYIPEDGVVLCPRAPGVPLSQYLGHPTGSLGSWLERAGAALSTLHHLPKRDVGPLEFHDFAAEIRTTEGASRYIPALLPQVGATINALLECARELHERLPKQPPTFTHGDFKAEHVWVTPGGLTLIDFDSCCLTDPALDVGKFLADLQVRHALYNRPGLEQDRESFLTGYAPGAERLVRSQLYEAVELVKLTARRVPLSERDWACRTTWLVARAHDLISDLQTHFRLPRPVRRACTRRYRSKFIRPRRARGGRY